jgi:hypothetical protein
MYEPRHRRPIDRHLFYRRLARHAAAAIALLLGSLLGGMAGYEHFEHLPWRDAFLNSAMLLGGMGPVDIPHTPAGKLFAGFFALYAGIIFLISASFVLAPFVHRLLHLFHWDEDERADRPRKPN